MSPIFLMKQRFWSFLSSLSNLQACSTIAQVAQQTEGSITVVASTETREDRDGEKPGPSIEASSEVDLTEDLALSDSEDSD